MAGNSGCGTRRGAGGSGLVGWVLCRFGFGVGARARGIGHCSRNPIAADFETDGWAIALMVPCGLLRGRAGFSLSAASQPVYELTEVPVLAYSLIGHGQVA
ncbi:MAG TPA: hypothetical protein VMD51_04425 [Mycobacterium sp.]|nr:hypothetical protein [Mycobacterium sp.]